MIDIIHHSPPAKAFFLGILSAVSLPIGAALGIWARPSQRLVAAIMSFGAGSLLAALTLELVDPAMEKTGFLPLAAGLILGGALFVAANQILCQHGGFLRKPATMLRHFMRTETARHRSRLKHLQAMDIMQDVPDAYLPHVLGVLARRYVKQGELLFRQGDHADSFFLLDNGEVEVTRPGQPPVAYCAGMSLGTRSFLSAEKTRGATAVAATDCKLWEVFPDAWRAMTAAYPIIRDNMERLNARREAAACALRDSMIQARDLEHNLPGYTVSLQQVHGHEHGMDSKAAALAIWLGILLDGIPESAVIGASMVHTSVSWALIIGLFLSNLPEAMSSAASMRRGNAPVGRILGMWISLMLLTGLGAMLGNIFLEHASHTTYAVFEGTAAGAMLVMVAETMLPEAYHHGGPVVGVCTLLGFMSALAVRSLG